MYAIVKAGGHQEKVEVGDVILVNRLDAKKGDTVEFPVALVVDGDKVTVNAKDLANISVKAEVVNDEAKGPKISIMKYKNKTGVARRKGHRQQLTLVKITAKPLSPATSSFASVAPTSTRARTSAWARTTPCSPSRTAV